MKSKMKAKILNLSKNPPLLLCLSFAGVILFGALLLNLPIASNNGNSIGFVDALFTSSSATGVNGLVVVNTAEYWTLFGKVVILLLIQIGGLGTMVAFSLLAMLFRKKIGVKERLLISEQLSSGSMSGVVKLSKYVISVSFAIEFVGALLLMTRFIPDYGVKKGIWYSVFHSISAFCNAGFDITGDSMASYSTDLIVSGTIMALVILGGLGFVVYLDMFKKRQFRKFSVHTKIVLVMTISLLLIGTVFIFILESSNPETIQNYSFGEKLLISAFQSTITRTAGFYSVDIGKLRDSTAFLMIILMFIGGSSASTAGGLKTTTIGVIIFSTISMVRGQREAVAFKKTIPVNIVLKCLSMIFICLSLVIVIAFSLSIIETGKFDFEDILFETTSAFGTVGLTRGITDKLTDLSKLLISLTMFMGRVGPTTLAIGLMRKKKTSNIKYSEGNVIVG
ncbi:trk system potassium uptake protein TrkH [Anaerosphaera aminiphila DSM 21120]|uniref:Trk system potassium uptake protein TrkH n=1 Tax=Anaerosphaera aminiphila DSM 21120 TaxID=1120995 RepID=A0A1M5NPF7_9FIRM|nr:TrkH family potassium uptake protein [Anaerosphaera aminiphila]SHG91412.1 trk system potassium uptake protein TrkH [Anaerosphaera aminiphila DSM 21120]